MSRQRLPERRPSVTTTFVHDCRSYAVTFGFDPSTGRIGEVFTHGAKVGSAMDGILDDACIALSLLLQHGVEPTALATSMGRFGDGKTPASVIGALADLIALEVQPCGGCPRDTAATGVRPKRSSARAGTSTASWWSARTISVSPGLSVN